MRQAYRTLMREGLIEEGDEAFDPLRQAYMRLTLISPEPPFPIDEIDGVTINRFYGSGPVTSFSSKQMQGMPRGAWSGLTGLLSGSQGIARMEDMFVHHGT